MSDQLRAQTASLSGTINAFMAPDAQIVPGNTFDLVVADQISASLLQLQTHGFFGRLDIVTISVGSDAGREALRLTVVPFAGDYNGDAVVDAADYVAWRDGFGFIFTQADYDVWKANLSDISGNASVADANVAVPEPATVVLLIVGMMASLRLRYSTVASL